MTGQLLMKKTTLIMKHLLSCPFCGKRIYADWRYCCDCGREIPAEIRSTLQAAYAGLSYQPSKSLIRTESHKPRSAVIISGVIMICILLASSGWLLGQNASLLSSCGGIPHRNELLRAGADDPLRRTQEADVNFSSLLRTTEMRSPDLKGGDMEPILNTSFMSAWKLLARM